MTRTSRRVALALAALCVPHAAHADDSPFDLVSAETVTVFGDVRLAATGGEPGWLDGGFGKLREGGGSGGDTQVRARLGQAGVVWQPRLGWALQGTVVALAQGGPTTEAGLSEAYLTYKPLGGGPVQVSARAGLMWPPVSLEHANPEWTVADTITPSAIGSWIGEEVKVVGAEATARLAAGSADLALSAAVFDGNDTQGALLTFRGWALHDRVTLLGRKQPLPPLTPAMFGYQPPYTHPLIDFEPGFFHRPGYYLRAALTLAAPVRIEAFHSDNRGDPEIANAEAEWGWRTRFQTLGVVAEPAPGWQLRAQGLTGTTRMGFEENGAYWIEGRFRSAYAMVTRRLASTALSARIEGFSTRNRGSYVNADDDEHGWAATLAAKHQFTSQIAVLVEALHVDSTRTARSRLGLAPRQVQNQIQAALRWRL